MSLVNVALQQFLNLPTFDNQVSTAINTQTGAPVLVGQKNRMTAGSTTQSFCLESIITGEASQDIVWVINDSPGAVNIFPAVGENQNGVANASLSIAAGRAGVFVRSKNPSPDWRSAVIT